MEREAGAGTRSGGAERGTEVTEAELRRAGLGTRRAGRGRSVPPTPDAQPALSAPTYPRERPAGDIPTPAPPLLPLRVESGVSQPRTGTQKHGEAHERAHAPQELRGRPLPTLRPRGAVRVTARKEPEKLPEPRGARLLSGVHPTPFECAHRAGL